MVLQIKEIQKPVFQYLNGVDQFKESCVKGKGAVGKGTPTTEIKTSLRGFVKQNPLKNLGAWPGPRVSASRAR